MYIDKSGHFSLRQLTKSLVEFPGTDLYLTNVERHLITQN